MQVFERIAEEKIIAAQMQGVFDNLPGSGKPLVLEDNPYEPEAWRMAYHLLRSNGFSLPWIEERRVLEKAIARLRSELLADQPQVLDPDLTPWNEIVQHINRRIFQYNLSAPAACFHLPAINLPIELQRAGRMMIR